MACLNCSCPGCLAIRERIEARRVLMLTTGQKGRELDAREAKEERRLENDRFNAMIWLLINAVDYVPTYESIRHLHWSTRLRHVQRAISQRAIDQTNRLAEALDLTSGEMNIRRRAYQALIRHRIRRMERDRNPTPWLARLLAAGAVKIDLIHDDHPWAKFAGSVGTELPVERPKCAVCGQNLSHRMTHLYGPCTGGTSG